MKKKIAHFWRIGDQTRPFNLWLMAPQEPIGREWVAGVWKRRGAGCHKKSHWDSKGIEKVWGRSKSYRVQRGFEVTKRVIGGSKIQRKVWGEFKGKGESEGNLCDKKGHWGLKGYEKVSGGFRSDGRDTEGFQSDKRGQLGV